jgi:hypothetical protein
MSEETLIAVVGISAVFGLPIILGGIAIVTGYLRQARVDELNAALKRELIARGFTADEIVQVINSGSGDGAAEKAAKPACRG